MLSPLNAPQLVITNAPAEGGGLAYRGEWTANPATVYAVDDVVVIGTGAAQGSYICVTAGATGSPATGVGWVQLSKSNAGGSWL